MRRWWLLLLLGGSDCDGGDLGLLHALLESLVVEIDFGRER